MMERVMTMRSIAVLGVGLLMGAASPAFAKDIIVHMNTKGPSGAYVFEPAFVQAAVGDKVHFVPSDGTHNGELIAGMMPAGVAPQKGPMGKEFVLTVSKPGLYGVECLPHFSMGMVGLVQAGPGPSPQSRGRQGGEAAAARRQADGAAARAGEVTLWSPTQRPPNGALSRTI